MINYIDKVGFYVLEFEFGNIYGMSVVCSDVLFEVLMLICLCGEFVYMVQLGVFWGICFVVGLLYFYFVEEGFVWVVLVDGELLYVNMGDLVLLFYGWGYLIVDVLDILVEVIDVLVLQYFNWDDLIMQVGGSGNLSCLVGGFFGFEGSIFFVIIVVLFIVVYILCSDVGVLFWLVVILYFLVDEVCVLNLGLLLMILCLIDLLVIWVLCSWVVVQVCCIGWFVGFGEECISCVLSVMYVDLFWCWMVNELVELVLMLCFIFVQCFIVIVGELLLYYFVCWCLIIVVDLLCSGGMKVIEVVQCVGYILDVVFSCVFKVYFGYVLSEVCNQ